MASRRTRLSVVLTRGAVAGPALLVVTALLLAGLVAAPPAALAVPSATSYISVSPGRITRSGTVLQVGGVTRRFAGANAYWLALDDNLRPRGAASIPPMSAVTDTLDALRGMHGTLLRVHTLGISYGDAEGNGTPTLMPRPGVYSEAMFVQIDRIIAEAGRRGIWLVAPMADRWNFYHGGGVTFAKMVLGPNATLSDFYANGSVRSAFKAYLSTWLNRVNSVTGVRYKDDPTVAVVELGNEMYDAPSAWTSEMAAFVKSVAPDVLVADPTAAAGKYVTDSNVALGDRNVDIFGDHFYPRDHWHLESDANAVRAAGKVFMLGEYDWTTVPQDGVWTWGGNVSRAQWLAQIESTPGVSITAWWSLLVPAAGAHLDGYELYVPTQNGEQWNAYAALSQHQQRVNGPGS